MLFELIYSFYLFASVVECLRPCSRSFHFILFFNFQLKEKERSSWNIVGVKEAISYKLFFQRPNCRFIHSVTKQDLAVKYALEIMSLDSRVSKAKPYSTPTTPSSCSSAVNSPLLSLSLSLAGEKWEAAEAMARAGGITNAVNVGIAVQADWENREFISHISLNVRRLFDFLLQFEATTKSKLATLNEKLDVLERRLEVLEVQVNSASENPSLFI
ncbi:putative protein BRICK1 [Dioscorea sansibarensis]